MVDARKPTAAGVFYPAEGEILACTIRELLAAVPSPPTTSRVGRVRAIVVPHAIRGAAGAVAAATWARVTPHVALLRRVVLLGPAHHTRFAGIAAPFADCFATPLGVVEVDRIAIETARRFPQLVVSDEPHEQEASLEVQVPFVQTLLPKVSIVPLLVGEVDDQDAAQVVDSLWDDETLLVVSTDLSHYHDASSAQRLDEATAHAIETLQGVRIGEEQACGHAALRALLVAAWARGFSALQVALRHSGEESGHPSEVIGFGGFVVG
jgi:AmmeMemoRadiSam system protein B